MSKPEKIRYLHHREIDYNRWDESVSAASNSRMYALSWYLDRAVDRWDALVWGDYRYVMPLPYKKRLGLKYIFQPWFCQQLGIFPAPSEKIATLFFQEVASHFRYADLSLNAGNRPFTSETFHFMPRKNFLLPLFTTYASLSAHYAVNTRRNINKAKKNRLFVTEGIPAEHYLDFFHKHQPIPMGSRNFDRLKNLVAYMQYRGFGKTMGVYTTGNELCATALICRWKGRILYLNPVSDATGKKTGAMFYLMDHLIRTHAASNVTIDFEGSMVPGIARFFHGFGASPESYHLMHYNQLPQIIRWIKKQDQ